MNASARSGSQSLKPEITDVTDEPTESSCDSEVSGKKGHARRSSKGKWTTEEVRKHFSGRNFISLAVAQDETLRRAVMDNKAKNWKKIAEHVPQRTDVQCLHRWQKVLNPELVKGPWTKEVRNAIKSAH